MISLISVALWWSPEVLANQHAGHLELLAFRVDIALALYDTNIYQWFMQGLFHIFCVCKSTPFVDQLASFRLHLAAVPSSRLCLGSCCCWPRAWRPWKIKTPRTSRESSRVSERVLPPGIGSAKLADSCMLIVALCCFLVPSSGAREAPHRFQTISISKHFFLSMY